MTLIWCADKFEESKENKLEYTEVFNQYTSFVESSIEKFLSSRIAVSKALLFHMVWTLPQRVDDTYFYRDLTWKSLSVLLRNGKVLPK